MPVDFCHPEAPHQKLKVPEWYVSSLMLDRALDAIVRRVKSFDRNHDIPYLAGYSNDGKTIYIDRHMPKSFKYNGREIDTDRYLILHEEVEKTLIDQLGLHYLHAHQIATRAEQAAVRAAGIKWRDYDKFMQKYVKRIGDERLTKIPADIDTKPYRDEHDMELLHRMSEAVEKGHAPKEFKSKKVRRAVTEALAHIKAHPKGPAKAKVTGKDIGKAGAKKAGAGTAAGKKALAKKSPKAA